MRMTLLVSVGLLACAALLSCSRSTNDRLTADQQSAITVMQDKLNNLKAKMDFADAEASTSNAAQRIADDFHIAWNDVQDKLSHLKTASAGDWAREWARVESSLTDLSTKLDDWMAKTKDAAKNAISPATVPVAPEAEKPPLIK